MANNNIKMIEEKVHGTLKSHLVDVKHIKQVPLMIE